ncbi:MAG: hypothetical protein R2789_19100 [Microthrixaceae bacterium]
MEQGGHCRPGGLDGHSGFSCRCHLHATVVARGADRRSDRDPLLVSAPYSFVVADRLNDSQHLADLSDTARREVRIANCERADVMCEFRIRLALCTTVVMFVAALVVSAADASSRGNPLPWAELVFWIGLTAAVEYGVVRFLSDPAR